MGFLGTAASDLSDASLLLLILAAAAITYAWGRAAAGEGSKHHLWMIVGIVTAWVFFLSYMANRIVHIASGTGGPDFPGPADLRGIWWVPLIAVHSLAATVALLWSLVQIASGYRNAKRKDGAWTMASDRRPRHARTGRAFLGVWYLTTATGVLVYASLYVIWS